MKKYSAVMVRKSGEELTNFVVTVTAANSKAALRSLEVDFPRREWRAEKLRESEPPTKETR